MQDINQPYTEPKNLSEQELNWTDLGIHTYIKIALLAAAIYYVFSIEVYSIVFRWITDSSWSHGFIIPFFSLYFLWQKKKEVLSLKLKPSYLGLVFLVCCVVFYLLFVFVYRFGYLKSLVIIPTIGSIILFIGGWQLVKYTWLPVGYLVFSITLPTRVFEENTKPSRGVSA